MKIPTTLKHKPVIVSENYENVDGRNAYHSDAKGLSLGLAQWNDRERWIFRPKYGGIRAKNGPGNRKSCRSTACWIWPSWRAGLLSISGKYIVTLRCITRIIR